MDWIEFLSIFWGKVENCEEKANSRLLLTSGKFSYFLKKNASLELEKTYLVCIKFWDKVENCEEKANSRLAGSAGTKAAIRGV